MTTAANTEVTTTTTTTPSTSMTTVITNSTAAATVPAGCLVFPRSNFTPWNHPEDLVSFATQQTFETIVDFGLLTLLFFISLPSNILNMIVFWKQGIKERINLCMFFLSLADLVTIAFFFEIKLDRFYAVLTNTPYKLVVAKFSFNNMIHLLSGFVYVSGFMSTLIALERCLCVLSPLKAQTMVQLKSTALVIAGGHLVILGAVYFPSSRWVVVCVYDPLTEDVRDSYYSSQFYLDNKDFIDALEGILYGVLLPVLYVVVVSVCTVVTVIRLRHMKAWREQSSSASVSGTNLNLSLTRMLIGTNVLFVVCTAPALFVIALLPIIPELSLTGKYYNTYNLLLNVKFLFTYINSSVNFFVYFIFGTSFRMTVKQMFSCCFKVPKKPDSKKSRAK